MKNTQLKNPSILGGAMIIAGTAIGAGMLANPTATAGVWFVGSIVVLLYTWFCMFTSGLMILEANLHYPVGSSFDTVVKDLLGNKWNIINGLSVAFVLYVLTYAYIFVGGGITQGVIGKLLSWGTNEQLEISRVVGASVFLLLLSFCVWISTKTVDRISTILVISMIILFVLSVTGMLNNVSTQILFDQFPHAADNHYWKYIWVALPVCLASFGYHGNVPSLVIYYKNNGQKVAKSLLIGTLMALLIYLLWQMAVQGNLPRHEFGPVIASGGDVPVLLSALANYIPTESITNGVVFLENFSLLNSLSINNIIDTFAFFAIISSFLGVTLGLFDYIADMLKFDNSLLGRLKTASLTFLPPYIACLAFPTGFVTVIGYVGLLATVWTGIVPALLLRASRKRFKQSTFTVWGGNFMIGFIMLFAILNILAQVLTQFGILPSFSG